MRWRNVRAMEYGKEVALHKTVLELYCENSSQAIWRLRQTCSPLCEFIVIDDNEFIQFYDVSPDDNAMYVYRRME